MAKKIPLFCVKQGGDLIFRVTLTKILHNEELTAQNLQTNYLRAVGYLVF